MKNHEYPDIWQRKIFSKFYSKSFYKSQKIDFENQIFEIYFQLFDEKIFIKIRKTFSDGNISEWAV